MVKIKNRTIPVVIILAIVALGVISFSIMYYYEKSKTDKEEQMIFIKLQQTESEFDLDLKIDTHEGLSDVKDLNSLLEPTPATDMVLWRWKVVHEIDPEYPYPEKEIKEQDWIEMNQFLHGKDEEDVGHKPEMIYDKDKNFDRDVFDYIMLGTSVKNEDHPIVEEAEERMEEEYFSNSSS